MFSDTINKELNALYRKFPDIKKFLGTLGCDATTAEDIFQEALLIYSRKRKLDDFELNVEPFFFVRSTCKLLWYNESRKKSNQQTYTLETDIPQEVEDWVQKELKILSIEKKLNEIGEQCKELLQLFYVKAWSMEDIAKKIGLRNDKVAKAQKYRCIQKLKDKVQVDFEILNPLENFSSLDSPHSSFESIKF